MMIIIIVIMKDLHDCCCFYLDSAAVRLASLLFFNVKVLEYFQVSIIKIKYCVSFNSLCILILI